MSEHVNYSTQERAEQHNIERLNELLNNKIKKIMCHHILKDVVYDRHLFLGCSEIKTI